MHIAHGMQKPGHLLLTGLDDTRVCVTGGGDAKRGGQIEIFFPVGIPNMNVLGAVPNDGPRTVRLNEHNVARLVIATGQEFDGFCSLNSLLFRRPDDFVHLHLESHRQRVGDDFFSQFALRNRHLAGGNPFQ